MPGKVGVDARKSDAGVCMASGCTGRALYQGIRKGRGYCAAHKHLAAGWQAGKGDKLADWLEERPDDGTGWTVKVDDDD